jgi:hypothetical protein
MYESREKGNAGINGGRGRIKEVEGINYCQSSKGR